MLRYILKRILQFIPVFLGVTLILFIMQNVVPGDPIKLIAGEKKMDPQTEMNIRAAHGLIVTDENGNIVFDEDGNTIETPMVDRYFNYLGNLLQGDLGTSYQKGRAVKDMIFEAYPHTVQIALVAIVIEAFVGIGAGIISAIKRYSFWDILVTLTTSVLVAMPAFWLGLLLQLIFGIWLKECYGWRRRPVRLRRARSVPAVPRDWTHYILPAVTLAAVSTAYTARIMRSQLVEVMNQDYIRTAKAKGLSKRSIIFHHALKNALIPVVTYIGMDFGAMLAGAILTETVFNWPGIGSDDLRRHHSSATGPSSWVPSPLIVFVVTIINLHRRCELRVPRSAYPPWQQER
ncbi:MAG: ABC transporter permease [Collinsella sp.]